MAKVLFYSNSLQRELEVEAINLKANTFVVRVDKRLMTLDGADKLFDRIRAEARAEALRGASDKICEACIDEWGAQEPCPYRLNWTIDKCKIRNALCLADEPKEERGAEVGDLIACVWNGKPNGAIGAYAGSGMTKRGEWTEEPIVLMRRAEVEAVISRGGI